MNYDDYATEYKVLQSTNGGKRVILYQLWQGFENFLLRQGSSHDS